MDGREPESRFRAPTEGHEVNVAKFMDSTAKGGTMVHWRVLWKKRFSEPVIAVVWREPSKHGSFRLFIGEDERSREIRKDDGLPFRTLASVRAVLDSGELVDLI